MTYFDQISQHQKHYLEPRIARIVNSGIVVLQVSGHVADQIWDPVWTAIDDHVGEQVQALIKQNIKRR